YPKRRRRLGSAVCGSLLSRPCLGCDWRSSAYVVQRVLRALEISGGALTMPASHRKIATHDTFDVVIIGAGVAGALVANVLAQKSLRVLLLEAGETGANRADLVLRYAAAAFKGLGVAYEPSDPSKIPGPEQPADPGDIKQARDLYYDQQGTEKYLS